METEKHKAESKAESPNYFRVLLGKGPSDLCLPEFVPEDQRDLSNNLSSDRIHPTLSDKPEVLYESETRENWAQRVKRSLAQLFQSPSRKGALIDVFQNLKLKVIRGTYQIICLISDSRQKQARSFIWKWKQRNTTSEKENSTTVFLSFLGTGLLIYVGISVLPLLLLTLQLLLQQQQQQQQQQHAVALLLQQCYTVLLLHCDSF